MVTATSRKKATSVRRTGTCEKDGVRKNNREELWNRYINASPKDIPLTDGDIMEAVREIRYGKVADNH